MKLKYYVNDFKTIIKFHINSFFISHFVNKDKRRLMQRKNYWEKWDKLNPAHKLSCKVGHHTYASNTTKVMHSETTIGNYCSISENVMIGPGEHPLNYLSSSPCFYMGLFGWQNRVCNFEYAKPCKIGNDVWIGHGAFIKEGVTIGDGAVIAAGAVVVKDVEPYAIIGGVPAKIIKYRFSEEIIKELLELKWWDMDEDILQKVPYENIEDAIKYLKKIKEENNAR